MAHFGELLDVFDTGTAFGTAKRKSFYIGGYIVTLQGKYLVVFDCNDPENISEADQYDHGAATPAGLLVEGDYIYVTAARNVYVWDWSDPTNLVFKDAIYAFCQTGSSLSGIAKYSDYLYLCMAQYDSTWNHIAIINVADPTDISEETHFTDATNLSMPRECIVVDNYLYLMDSDTGKLVVYDVTSPTSPSYVTSLTVQDGTGGGGWHMKYLDDYLYCVGFNQHSIDIIDISTRTAPSKANTLTDATLLNAVQASEPIGNFLYGFNRTGTPYQVSAWSIATPSSPSFVESFDVTDAAPWSGDGRFGSVAVNEFGEVYIVAYYSSSTKGIASIGITAKADGVYVEFAGTEVQSQAYGIRTERGRETELNYAPAGIAELTMDNSEGDFSPENAGGAYYGTLDLGILVYIYEIYGGVIYPLFTGQTEKIVPQDVPGGGGAQAFILCTDGMDDLNATIVETAVRTVVKAGQLVEDILDDAEAFVGARDIDTGITVFDVAFFSGKEALAQIRSVEDQERGRFYIDVDGDAQFEDRHHRILNHKTSEYDFGTKLRNIQYEWSKRDLYNRIQITGTKYTEDATSEYLWGTEAGVAATAVIVPANGSITIWATFSQVLASYTALVAGTHWNTNTEIDKSGTDTTASVSLAATQYGKAIKMVFTSTYNADSYLVVPDSPPAGADANRTAIVMGKLYQEDVIQHVETYASSISTYRKKGMALTTPFLGDPDELRTLASFIGTRHSTPQPMAIRVTIHARTDWPTDDILKQVLSRKISDRITLASTLLGFDQDFYIEKVIHDYKQFEGKFNLDVTWVCSRASEQDSLTWLLEIAGFGELEENTYLSY